jgi:hypothetical protein
MKGQKCACVCKCTNEQADLSWTCVDCRYGRCPVTPARSESDEPPAKSGWEAQP